jgi:hypothetical protein
VSAVKLYVSTMRGPTRGGPQGDTNNNTGHPAGRPGPISWVDTQPAHLIDAAVDIIRSDDPDAWKLFGGDQSPRYALWAYLCLAHADTLPFPAAMGLVDALRGPAGPASYQAGMSPAGAALNLAGDGGRRPRARPACSWRPPRLAVQPVEVEL